MWCRSLIDPRGFSPRALRLAFAILLLAGTAIPTRAAAQGAGDDASEFSRAYHAVRVSFSPTSRSTYEIFAAYGQTILAGAAGAWMLRLEAAGGLSAWSEAAYEGGYFAGSRQSLVRVFTGDYLSLGAPIELFVSAGTGFYFAWNIDEARDERNFIPLATAGIGFRSRPGTILPTFELHYEERIGDWNPRVAIAVGLNFPW